MRKFLALIMTIIILLGTLSPVVFELGGVQQKFELKKQLAMADNTNVETTFDNTPNTAVSIEKVAGKPKFFKLVTKIKYNYAVTPDNEPFQEVAFALGGVLDPNAIILKKDSQIKIYENDIDPAPSGLHNNRWGYIAQEFEITNDGVYQGWFWENYTWPKEDLESSKLEFEIKNGEIVSQKIYQYATNQRNAINVVFNVPVVAIDETKPTTATVTGTVTYSDITNPTAQSNTNAPINISWELFDSETNEKISTKTISINPIPKLNTNAQYAFTVENLVVDKKYKIWIIENEITTTDGSKPRSREINFTAGKADSVKEVPQQNPNNDPETDSDFNCSFTDVFCGLVKFFVWFTTFIPSVVASIAGLLSDFFLHKAIQPEMYGKSYTVGIGKMIYDSWKTVRDFSNILFIFALFVAAFMLIVDQTKIGKTNFEPKKVVGKVIIMALLVNFSLFFCRMIIQTADIFSHILYNQITVTDNSTGAIKTLLEKVGVKSISFGLVNKANPQQLMISAGVDTKDKGSTTGYLATGIIVLFVYLIFIYIFVSMLFIWMGRIIGSWMAMILAPIAFVSFSIPFIEDNDYIGFKKWLENFVHLAFLVPIYLFFVYIALSVMNLGELSQDIGTIENGGYLASTIQITLKTLIPLLASTFILLQGKTIAYKLSGVIGEMAGKISGSVTGLALGAATGGTALLARQTLGRAGAALAEKTATSTGVFGKGLNTFGKKLGSATYDVRNNKTMMDGFGKFTGAAGEKVDLGTKGLQKEGGFNASGGFTQMLQDRADRIEDEQARKREAEALERANNPQSPENIRKRNAERRKAQAEKARAAEKARIDADAENQTVDISIDKLEKEQGKNDSTIKQIDDQLTSGNALSAEEMAKKQEEKVGVSSQKQEIEEMLKNPPRNAAGEIDATKVAELTKQKAELEEKEKVLDIEMNKKLDKEGIEKLTKQKAELEEKNSKITQNLKTLENHKGKTVAQMKKDMDVAKIAAQDTPEYKAVAEAEAAIKEDQEKINKLTKEAAELRKEGKHAEAADKMAEVKALKTKINTSKAKGGDLHKAKEEFDKSDVGKSIKELDSVSKMVTSDYVKSKKSTLEPFEKEIRAADIELKEANYLVQQRTKQILGAHATALEQSVKLNDTLTGNTSVDFGKLNTVLNKVGIRKDHLGKVNLSEMVGTITGGRVMGGSVGSTNQTTATNLRKKMGK